MGWLTSFGKSLFNYFIEFFFEDLPLVTGWKFYIYYDNIILIVREMGRLIISGERITK